MSIINKYKKYFFNPKKLIIPLGTRGFFNWLSDRKYLELAYWAQTGRKLNLKNPKTFNEKIQWLKLYDRKPEYSIYADKYEVRQFISATIGSEYLIPLIGIYKSVDEINWDDLPKQFVLKCTHGSGSNIICPDKSKLNIEDAKIKLKKWMKKSWFWFGREWPYKNIKPRIIVEEFLINEENSIPNDYKCWAFNGEVKFINVHFHEEGKTKINIYNTDWKLQSFGMVYNNNLKINHIKPLNLVRMIKISEKIAKKIGSCFLRVDFYEVNGKLYSGEITFYPTSGFIRFFPDHNELDRKYGDLLELKR
jgi:hypothetical protein